jgi:hypothetical protein
LPGVPSGVSGNPQVASPFRSKLRDSPLRSSRPGSAASREVAAPLRGRRQAAYRLIWFAGPSSALLESRPRGFPLPACSPVSEDPGSPSRRLQLFSRDPVGHYPVRRRATEAARARQGSSHGVFAPSSVRRSMIGHIAGLHPDADPPRPFSDPRGIPSSTPAALFHAAAAHGVTTLQSFPPPTSSTGLVTRRNPHGVLLSGPKTLEPRPQGILLARSPLLGQEYFVLCQPDALLGFSAPTAFDGSGCRGLY